VVIGKSAAVSFRIRDDRVELKNDMFSEFGAAESAGA
jgi:hypothetical protein